MVATTRDDAHSCAGRTGPSWRAERAPRIAGGPSAQRHANEVTGPRMVLGCGPGAQQWKSWQSRQLK